MLRGRTRVQNACQRCRKQKIKCSGLPPCRTCRSRGLRCDFGAEEKHVLISERELFDLRSRVSQAEDHLPQNYGQTSIRDNPSTLPGSSKQAGMATADIHHVQTQPSTNPQEAHSITFESATDQFPSKDVDDTAQGNVANPLVPGQPAYVLELTGQLRYLGHSSTYAFTQQVLHMLQHNPPSNPSPEVLLSSNGTTYKAESQRLLPLANPDVSKLPSKGIALHYLQSIKFRTQPLFYLFDEVDFNAQLQNFYKNAFAYAQANPVWYVHYLVLMAFGKALDPHEQLELPSTFEIPEHFTRALYLMPDISYLADFPVESTELLCSIALFLQSTDHRRAAISYIGLALRMAHLYALHLDLQESIVGPHGVERGRRVWWTVYALNQRLTSNIGLPNFLYDPDITSPAPAISDYDEDETAAAIHIKICQLLGLSISRLYSSSKSDRNSFASTTRTILRGAASVANEVKRYSETCFGEISRCIIVTCRPALFCLLKFRSENWEDSRATSPSTTLTGLIQVCVDSATQAVQILEQLRRHNLLDTFLPFDLDCGFGAAFVLIMATHICQKVLPPSCSIQNAKEVIGAIAARGNAQAKQRSVEVDQLEEMLIRQTHQLTENTTQVNETNTQTVPSTQTGNQQMPDYGALFFTDFELNSGFSGNQMMDLADALSTGDFDLLGL